jgi:predicted HicB family RNase H-like nuclease
MDQLVVIVDEWLAIHDADGTELPPATNTEFSGKLTLRINPSLHRALALRSTASGSSLNRYIENTLAQSLG